MLAVKNARDVPPALQRWRSGPLRPRGLTICEVVRASRVAARRESCYKTPGFRVLRGDGDVAVCTRGGRREKNEIILFYLENLADYTAQRAEDFPEEPTSSEHKRILAAVDANSRKAFIVAH